MYHDSEWAKCNDDDCDDKMEGALAAVAGVTFGLIEEGAMRLHNFNLGNQQQATVVFMAGQKRLHHAQKAFVSFEQI